MAWGMTLALFLTGLAHFTMGLIVALHIGRRSPLPIRPALGPLAASGFLHAVSAWSATFLLAISPQGTSPYVLRVLAGTGLAVASLSLIYAGALLIGSTLRGWPATAPSPSRPLPLRQFALAGLVPLGLLFVWIVAIGFSGTSASEHHLGGPTAVCWDCHTDPVTIGLAGTDDWLVRADVWSRYLLYLPGSLLVAFGLMRQRPIFLKLGLPRAAADSWLAGLAAVGAGLLVGLVVPPISTFPASTLNYGSFYVLLGVPPQAFRALTAIVLTAGIARVAQVFQAEHERKLDLANEELRRREAVQRELVARLLTAQEDERRRLARELHDEVGQVVSALAFSLSAAELALDENPSEARHRLTLAREVSERTLDEVHKLILDLRPSVLDDLGLVPALRWYARACRERFALAVSIQVDGIVGKLPHEHEVVLFRIVQEGITNAVRHGRAKSVVVRLEVLDENVVLAVSDDGTGFAMPANGLIPVATDRAARSQGGGFGIPGMRERAALVGGSVRVESEPGRGTTVEVRLPLKETEGRVA